MKKLACIFGAVALAFTTSCSDSKTAGDNQAETVQIIHALDTVQVPKNPQRIVVLDYSELEDLDLIGANVVGMPKTGLPAHLSKYGDNKDIVDLGSLVEVNMEKINELQPDLIIIGGRLQESYPEFSKIAPTMLREWNTADQLGALKTNLDNLGKIFNKEEVFNEAYRNIVAKAERIKTKEEASDKKALVVLHNKGKMSAYGKGSRFGLIHDILGVKEAATGLDTHLHGTRVSSEFLLDKNPDILFVVDRSDAIGDKALDKTEFENQLVKNTNAYKNNKIVYLNSQVWYLAGGGVASINMMMDEVEKAID